MMTPPKITGGDWLVDPKSLTATVRSSEGMVSIVRCYQGDADAKFIAASPRVAAALANLLARDVIDSEAGDCYDECREALLAAGYTDYNTDGDEEKPDKTMLPRGSKEMETPGHVWTDFGGNSPPRCVKCGCDEDDAFVGGQECIDEPKDEEADDAKGCDICNSCGKVFPAGTLPAVSETDFELICPECTAKITDADKDIVIQLRGGYTLCCGPGEVHAHGGKVSIHDPNGEELIMWTKDEWRDDPECVMGTIMNVAKEPQKVDEDGEAISRRLEIVELADEEHGRDGELEIDGDATVSEGTDNGAYVQAWVWVDFSGTKFDKDLKSYRVTLREEKGDKQVIVFDCKALDSDHADEQAEEAYPGCEIINTFKNEDT